jgi:hypothetical protein
MGIILHSYLLVPMGEKVKWLSKSPLLAINAKGGESIKPKAKEPHHHLILNYVSNFFWYISNWYVLFSIGIFRKIDSQNWYLNSEYISNWYLSKPS